MSYMSSVKSVENYNTPKKSGKRKKKKINVKDIQM